MGLLAPFYLIGLAALSIPLLLHLIRRTPKGRQVFSSLMFLSPTPPRLTRRSRLDQILLLLLRLGVLALLALAFTRPFVRESALLSVSDLPRRRVAILVDASASLRRGDLWEQSLAKVEDELEEMSPQDDVALYAFDDRLRTIVGFERDPTVDDSVASQLLLTSARELKPTWSAGDLGTALTTLAGELDASSDVQQSLAEPQIILVSDLQQGSRLEALQAYEWPDRVRVIPRLVAPTQPSNATVQLLTGSADEPTPEPRVKVSNAADSALDQFFVRWSAGADQTKATGDTAADEVAVYVPAGESRVVKLPRPENKPNLDRVLLRGDDHDFDNTHFVVPIQKQPVQIRFLGLDKADDPLGLLYYLQAATLDDPLRDVKFPEAGDPRVGAPSAARSLTVVAAPVTPDVSSSLKTEVERGATVLLVLRDPESLKLLSGFFDDVEVSEPTVEQTAPAKQTDEFQLLGEIDFTHPLFAPFASPRYSDFTKIHFWQHRIVALQPNGTTRVLARFDEGSPWLLERTIGSGRLLALTSGWNPDDSQLALSSKFVTLVGKLLDLAYGSAQPLAGVLVNEPVSLPADRTGPLVIRTPDGRELNVPAVQDNFPDTAAPGIYSGVGGLEPLQFAVNLSSAESETAPLPVETLEQFGVRLGALPTQADRLGRIRQQRDMELESRQKVWRWLLVGCLALVIAETWYAGRSAGPRTELAEAVP